MVYNVAVGAATEWFDERGWRATATHWPSIRAASAERCPKGYRSCANGHRYNLCQRRQNGISGRSRANVTVQHLGFRFEAD